MSLLKIGEWMGGGVHSCEVWVYWCVCMMNTAHGDHCESKGMFIYLRFWRGYTVVDCGYTGVECWHTGVEWVCWCVCMVKGQDSSAGRALESSSRRILFPSLE